MSKRLAKRDRGICDPSDQLMATYPAILKNYPAKHVNNNSDEHDFYRGQPSLNTAITLAATARTSNGGKHGHQWRIPPKLLSRFGARLLEVRGRLKSAPNFHELWIEVKVVGGRMKGIGELTIYDTAHRVGIYLRKEPEYVYLHAGARAGARALGLPVDPGYLRISDVPKELRHLKPSEIEDCLCIYKHSLSLIRAASR